MENQNTEPSDQATSQKDSPNPTTPPDPQQTPTLQTTPPPKNDGNPPKNNKIIFITILIIVVLAISIVGVFAFQQKKSSANQQQLRTPTQDTVGPTNIPADTPTENAQSPESDLGGESVSYTSDKLGLTFSYAPTYSSWNYVAYILEEDSKIYVGPKRYYEDNPESFKSHFIEVFAVEVGLSVKEDIQKRFLSGYPPEDCYVTDPKKFNDSNNTTSSFPLGDNYRYIDIEASGSREDMESWMEAIAKCPQTYTSSNGVSYFAFDTTKPDKYIFYSIGQEPPWPASTESYGEGGSGISWIQTIEFTR
jgi:hypothetical protein